jgi:hypothetical protein
MTVAEARLFLALVVLSLAVLLAARTPAVNLYLQEIFSMLGGGGTPLSHANVGAPQPQLRTPQATIRFGIVGISFNISKERAAYLAKGLQWIHPIPQLIFRRH